MSLDTETLYVEVVFQVKNFLENFPVVISVNTKTDL